MIENSKYVNYIFSLYNSLRGAFFSKNIGFSVIRLVFLKYASDNCLGAETREEMQAYMRVQCIFAARDIDGGPNGLVPVLSLLDERYQLNGLMRNAVNEYAKELFGLDDSWIRKNASTRDFVEIMSVLSSMDLTDDLITHEKGKLLALNLIENLQYHGENARLASPYYSRRELGSLINKILNVNDNETFLDFCSGIGTTTISAVGSKNCKILCNDIDQECLSVAAMLYMMCGYEEFKLDIKNRFPSEYYPGMVIDEENKIADKIFVDPPIGLRVKNHPLRESSLIALDSAASLLKENGTAIVMVPASVLSSKFIATIKLREELIGNGYVQSVVALPLTFIRTSVSMYMIVLSKKQNKDVLFVNYTSFTNKANKLRGGNLVSEEQLDKLAQIVCNSESVENVSRRVGLHEIVSKEFDLTPMLYIAEAKQKETISIEEIDSELKNLYAKLGVK